MQIVNFMLQIYGYCRRHLPPGGIVEDRKIKLNKSGVKGTAAFAWILGGPKLGYPPTEEIASRTPQQT